MACRRGICYLSIPIFLEIILFISSTKPTTVPTRSPFDSVEPGFSTALKVIKKLQNYPLILHYENQSQSRISSALNQETIRTRYLWNYDLQSNYQRPMGHRYLHMIDLSNLRVNNLDKYFFKRISSRDIVIFLIGKESVTKQLINYSSHSFGLFIVSPADSKLYSCSYSSRQFDCSLKLIDIEEVNLESISRSLAYIKGLVFKVGYVLNAPYVYKDSSSGSTIVRGVEVNLISTLSKALDFRYELISFSTFYKGSKWNAMLKNLKNRSIYVAMGSINQNHHRNKKFDFTRHIKLDGLSVLYYPLKEQHSLSTPFDTRTRGFQFINLFILLSIFFIFLIGYVENRYLGIIHYDQIKFILAIIRPLLDQSYQINKIFMRKSSKFVFLMWWVFCYFATVTYKNHLISSFIPSSLEFTKIEDLLAAGYRFESSEDDFIYIQENCGNSSICIDLIKRHSTNNLCEASSKLLSEKMALLGERYLLKFKALRKCKKLSLKEKYETTFLNDNIMGIGWHSLAMRKNSGFTELFSKTISYLEASGIINYWYKLECGHVKKRNNRNSESIPLGLKIFFSAFIILIIGYIISTLVFVLEFHWNNKSKRLKEI